MTNIIPKKLNIVIGEIALIPSTSSAPEERLLVGITITDTDKSNSYIYFPETYRSPKFQYTWCIEQLPEILKNLEGPIWLYTHSPVVIATLNNMIASYKDDPTSPLVINFEHVTQWEVSETGYYTDILDYESQLLTSNYFDKVSEMIFYQFERLI